MVKQLTFVFLFVATAMCIQAQSTELLANVQDKEQQQQIAVERTVQEVPTRLARKFKRDAARLALRLEAKKEDLRYQHIIIPKATVNSIYEVLTSVYRNNETAQSISKCNVHTFPNPSIDHLVLVFDREIEWAEPLLDGINETDSDEFNLLMEEYELIIDKYVQWDDEHDAITIRSKEPLNMAALANEFYNIEGITNIDLGIPKIGGNDININRIEKGWELQYILRFGSYISGRGKVHIWTYNVMDDGEVLFINESGDPVPDWMRCHFDSSVLAQHQGFRI